jgi:hypothetical protein
METIKPEIIESGNITYDIKPEENQTASGLYVNAGEISEDYDKVEWSELIEDYTQMRNGGAVESTTISILKYPIMRSGYVIEHDNKDLVDYANWCLDSLIDSFGQVDGFQEFLNHAFLALEFGCAFFEKIYRNAVTSPLGKITNIISRLAPFKAETIWEFHYNDTMQFSGIRHEKRMADSMNTLIDIPVEKLFFYSHNTEFGDPRGRSELRPIRNLYKIKKDILLATARTQQRGAGIYEIKSNRSSLKDEDKQRLNAVGRTIGNMKSGYIITDESTEIKVHAPQIQSTPEAMLEFINREMFFNTLTEFMTSGIGQNGSRSATSEHKGSYELKCGVVTQSIEKKINLLIREMVDISYFGKQNEYPKFKFNTINNVDVAQVSDSLIKFYSSAILVKQAGDEQFIRGLFGMPDKELVNGVEEVNKVVPPKVQNNVTNNNLDIAPIKDFSSMKFNKVLSALEQTEFIKSNFDVEGTEELYVKMQEEAQGVIADVVDKYLKYIAKQTEAGAPIEIKYDAELTNRLNAIYKTGYSSGTSAVKNELAKLSSVKLSDVPSGKMIGISQSIKRFAGRLLYNIKTVTEDKIETEWDGKEPIQEFIIKENLADGFKTDKRTLIQKTSDGYLDGRASEILANEGRIELYYYNSILDMSLCDNCALLTGSVMTLEEAKSMNLFTGKGRVNSNCQGGLLQCRCNLMPYKLKGGLI